MTILECTNLDMGPSEPLFNGGGAYSISTSNGQGTYSFAAPSVGAGTAWLLWGKNNIEGNNSGGVGSFINESTLYCKFNIYITTLPAANSEQIYCAAEGGGSPKLEIRVSSAGKLLVYDNSANLVATGTTTINLNTRYEIQVMSSTGNPSPYEIYINGVLEMSGSCDQYTVDNDLAILGKFINRNGQSITCYYTNIFIANALVPHGMYIKVSIPIANGSTFQWIDGSGASDYTQVREIPQDGNTTYIQSPILGNEVSLVRFQTRATLGITDRVTGIKSMACKRGAIGAANQSVRVRSGGTNADTALELVDTTYRYRGYVYETDPSTGVAFTNAAIDAVEVGVVEQAVGALSICTQIMCLFLVNPAVNPPGGGSGNWFRKGFLGDLQGNMYG